jgi:DNA-binding NtrC family response regulator
MKLLVVDDDDRLRLVLANELRQENYLVEQAECGRDALEMVRHNDFDVILLDLNLPDTRGKTVIKKIKAMDVSSEVVILTGYGSIESAVETIKLGAYDYVTKPYEMKKLMTVIEKAGERKTLLEENQQLKTQLRKCTNLGRIVTKNKPFLKIIENARNFAKCDFPIMLIGETGVGKELIAEEIHRTSERAEGPFVPVNCGAIPGNMVESELFGHEKGAYTSAHAKKIGLMELANHGTLFLDEIGDFPFEFQRKLLRALETKRFFRIGGIKQIAVDVRIVSATNKDLRVEMEHDRFRKDLYYRLSTLMLNVPPLRLRSDDIPDIVENILKRMGESVLREKKFSKEAMGVLKKYRWPGNVRELQNVVYRTLLLSNNKGVIDIEDLPRDLMSVSPQKKRRLRDVERDHILSIMEEVGGKRGEAAKILGIDPKTLYRKLLDIKGDVV